MAQHASYTSKDSSLAKKSFELRKILAEVCFTKGAAGSLYVVADCYVAIMDLNKTMTKPLLLSYLEFANSCLVNTHNLNKEVKNAIKEGLMVSIMVIYSLTLRSASTLSES